MSESAHREGGGGKKRLIMIVLAVVLIGGGGAGAWFGGLIGHGNQSSKAQAAAEKPVLVDLPDMISNLDTGGRRASFVKLHVKLQVDHAADVAAITAAEPELIDMFQTYLREMRPEELRGGEGTYRLREALMNRVDARLAPVQVSDLLFTQLLVQ
ncbi:flagellar basal body-associated FliL family protein [Acetobacteraceae bacterium KSS8]|uniref:Flagellar protein FliL n=1 Tax=Endosaccharibacter trunci TaxID=2812733 RepID=A0ABT1WB87_9PROT|nr:flagellar basal body-associated FliL family protein [Acetobacteraceae bacterium KSS8]